MEVRWLAVVGMVGLGLLQQVALAQVDVQPPGAMPGGIQQKQALVRSLVEDEAAARRIQSSQDEEARRFYGSAREAYAGALAAINAGDFRTADKLLSEAMAAMGKARRKVPDAEALAARQRAAYGKALEGVESLEKACRARLTRLPGSKEADEFARLGITGLEEEAKAHAKENRWDEAMRALERAEQAMRVAVSRAAGALLTERAQAFGTPAEEYAFELERNASLFELVPVAIAQLGPTEAERDAIDSLVMQNQNALLQSDLYVRAGDYQAALASVRTGTGFLQLALSAAGLVVPADSAGR